MEIFKDLMKIIKLYKNDMDNEKFVSPYHYETPYCHTLMVVNEVLNDNKIIKDEKEKYLIIAFLHDIGKPFCEMFNKKKQYWMTPKHENYSMILSIKHLLDLQKKYNFSDKFIKNILYTINYHGISYQKSKKQIEQLFKENKEIFNNIQQFSKYDNNGRISFCKKEISYDYNFKSNDIEFSKKPIITMMIGLPGSGKDFYIQNDSNLKNQKVLSRDDLMMELYGGNNKTYNEVWDSLSDEDQKNINKELMKRFSQFKKENKNFIINLTNLSIKSRKKWFDKRFNYNLIVMLPPLDIIQKRLHIRYNKTKKFISETVLNDMIKRFELPLYGEFEQILNIKILFE